MAGRPFDPLKTEPERVERGAQSASQTEGYAEGDWRELQARQTKMPDKSERIKMSVDEARKALSPNATPDEIKTHAKRLYQTITEHYQQHISAEQTALKEAEAKGAGIRAADIRKDDGSLPDKTDEESWLGTITRTLRRGARGAVGAVAGAQHELRDITKDVPLSQGSYKEPRLDVKIPGVDFTDIALAGVPIAGPVLIAGRHALTNVEKPESTNISVGASDIVGAVAPPLGTLMKATMAGGNPRALGIPLGSAAKELAQQPSKLLDVAKSAGTSALAAFNDRSPQTENDLITQLEHTKSDYIKKSVDQAKSELGEASNEQIKARAKEIYKNAVDSDLMTVKNPNLAQMAGEFLLDPLNIVPVGEIAGAAGRLARKLPGAERAIAGAYKATEGFRHMPVNDPLRMSAHAPTRDIALLSELAEQEAQRVPRIIGRLRESPLAVIQKIQKGMSDTDIELLHDFATGKRDIADLPKEWIPALQANKKLGASTNALKNAVGLSTEFKDGILRQADTLEHYVPRRLKKEVESAGLKGVDVQPEMRSNLNVSSAKARTAATDAAYIPDIAKQWEAELRDVERQGTAALEIKRTRKMLSEEGALIELPVSRGAGRSERQAEAAVAKSIRDEAFATKHAVAMREEAVKMSQDAKVLHTASEGKATGIQDARKAESLKIQAKQLENKAQLMAVEAQKLERKAMQIKGDRQGLLGEAAVAQKNAETARQSHATAEHLGKELTDKTGVEWVRLQPELQKVVSEKSGRPLVSHQGDTLTILPKPIAERFRALTPLLSNTPNATDEAVKGYGKLMQAYIRPIQRIWRTAKTLPAPVFHVKNGLGAFSLSTVAHGLSALNPKLQGAAVLTALEAAGFGSKRAMELPFLLKSGQTIKLGEALRIAKRLGIVDQFSEKMGAAMTISKTSVLGHAAKAVEDLASFNIKGLRSMAKISPAQIARATDNYQHLVVFLGFLEGTSNEQIAKALKLTSEFSGNYRRLGAIEKTFFREAFSFYSWSRFIFPHILKQLVVNPQRLGAYVKIRDAFEREYGKQAPFTSIGVGKQIGATGFTAPPSAQPAWAEKFIKTGKLPSIGSHEFAMMIMEDPLSMGLAILPQLETMFDVGSASGREQIVSQIGPLAQFAMQLITKQDIDDNPTGEFAHIFPDAGEDSKQWWQRASNSQVGTFMSSFTDRGVTPWMNLYRLYADQKMPREGLDLQLRYKVGRDFMGLDNRVMQLMGKEGRSLGGMAETGIPATTILQRPYKAGIDQKKKAIESVKPRVRQLERPGTLDSLIYRE